MKSGKDIARETGFSVSTVMKVLCGNSKKYKISRETECKILACAERLSYHRSEAALTTKTGVSRTVGVALYQKTFDASKEAVSGIIREGAARSYAINTFFDDSPETMISSLLSRRIKYLISTALDRDTREKTAALCSRNGINLVFVYENSCGGCPAVNTDNFNGMRLAVGFLIGCGHRRIGLCCNRHFYHYEKERHAGYIAALSEAGIKVDERFIHCRDIDNHLEMARDFAAMKPGVRPTAFVSTTDADSVRFANAFTKIGIRVPEDVSLCGFGNSRIAEFSIVPVSSVAEDTEKIGSVSLRVLFGEEKEIIPDSAGNYLLPVKLVIRDSIYNISANQIVKRRDEDETS